MGQLRNAIKRQPAARRVAWSELLRARSSYPGPIVGLWRIWITAVHTSLSLSLSLSLSAERKLHREKHSGLRNTHHNTRTAAFVTGNPKHYSIVNSKLERLL